MVRHSTKTSNKQKTASYSKSLATTAYHEAGHTVANVLHNIPFRYVSIEDNKRSVGHVQTLDFPRSLNPTSGISMRKRTRLESDVMALLAGNITEKHYSGRADHRGARSDRHQAMTILSQLSGSDEELSAYYKWLKIRISTEILEPRNWKLVKAIATALLKQRTITAREIRKIVMEESGLSIVGQRLEVSPFES